MFLNASSAWSSRKEVLALEREMTIRYVSNTTCRDAARAGALVPCVKTRLEMHVICVEEERPGKFRVLQNSGDV